MKIKKDGLLYLLWRFTHTFTEKKDWESDNPVSLWRYGWRIVLLTIPTALMAIMMVCLGTIIMGLIIVIFNLITLLTLRGVYWFNFTDRDGFDGPAFKPIYEFARIKQHRIKMKKVMNRWWNKVIPQVEVEFVDEDEEDEE